MNKYEHVKRYIKDQLQSNAIKPGAKLMSIREISSQFACSKNTVIRAYDDLEKEHLIYSVPKSGYYAVQGAASDVQATAGLIDFSSAAPDPEVMPYEDFQHCLNRAIALYQDQLFSYTDPQGFLTLRQSLAKHLADSQIFARPEHICVVSGSQQALHLANVMPFPNGKSTVLVEQPAYSGMLRSLELLHIKAVGIARTKDGVDLEELERHFRNNNIKFFYTVSRYHNPTGWSYTQEQKKQIARLASKYDVYIVEDDYLGDLEIDRKADPIYSYDTTGHVIYTRSFSKVMLPGLRLALAVLPKRLIETFTLFKSSNDLSTAALSQAALEIYLNSGMFDRHVTHMRSRYRERMKVLQDASLRYLAPRIQVDAPQGGIFCSITLPDGIDAWEIAAALRQQEVLVTPSDRFYLPAFPSENALRVSVIRTDDQQIHNGIRRIAEAADRLAEVAASGQMRSAREWHSSRNAMM
ncbi:PLP-dependent aminotransferase family protein [Paenibacillus oenotherae]|uniref:PLP-dependent aminotransferase family protein n=1 Tax=Paenibacillus oenotherae TaxID=1435645 RepID=A0ABS7DB25_9BACL|nr:PLP-dependent aminotransferase family protein [Paenibacillus oenotherae]MBW7477091.1 PLP-dependent aminotransferase family protein [Paenibacillus oenotherae]